MIVPPSPEVLRQVAREALAIPCTCGSCPSTDALEAIVAMSDDDLVAAMDELGLR